MAGVSDVSRSETLSKRISKEEMLSDTQITLQIEPLSLFELKFTYCPGTH